MLCELQPYLILCPLALSTQMIPLCFRPLLKTVVIIMSWWVKFDIQCINDHTPLIVNFNSSNRLIRLRIILKANFIQSIQQETDYQYQMKSLLCGTGVKKFIH